MDSVATLSGVKNNLTSQENEVIERYFVGRSPPTQSDAPSDDTSPSLGWVSSLKSAAVVTVLFVILSNPLTVSLVDKLPYFGGSSITNLAFRMLLLFLLTLLVFKFLL